MSVIATGAQGSLAKMPSSAFYMRRIAAGPRAAKAIDLEASVTENVRKVAKALGKSVHEMSVVVLLRPRHDGIVADLRKLGARVMLIDRGDLAAAISTCVPETSVDLQIGIGGSPEGVLSAVAIKILGGQMYGQFCDKNGKAIGKIYDANGLAKGNQLTFTATGVIDGPLLQGVRVFDHKIITHSLVIRGQSGTLRYITTHHHANK